MLHFLNREFFTHNITTLDIASLFRNAEVVKLLLNHLNHQSKVQINSGLDLVCFPDSTGRVSLHLLLVVQETLIVGLRMRRYASELQRLSASSLNIVPRV